MDERGRIADYGDDDLTFFMLIHGEHDRARECLSRIREHFPGARVIARTDGDDDPRHEGLAEQLGVELHREPHRFGVEHGALVVERMFELYLDNPSGYLFKVDPDTHVHRRFRYLPRQAGHFGTLQGVPGAWAVQGGCMGFTLDAARAFADSGLLRHPAFRDPAGNRDGSHYFEVLSARAQRVGLASFDWTLGWIAARLGIAVFEFPEVHSLWRGHIDNRDLRFAITHPAR